MPSYQFRDSEPAAGGRRFYGTPKPLFCESFASWVQRVCQHFDMTYASFARLLGVAFGQDVDLALDDAGYRQLARLFGLADEDFALMRLSFGRCVTSKPLRRLLYYRDDGRLAYRFCPCCLRADSTPYYRLEWRFEHWTICPQHRVKMEYACLRCGTRPQMQRTILSGSRSVPTLAHCCACACDMRQTGAGATGSEQMPELNQVVSTERAVVSAVVHGYFSVVGFRARRVTLRRLPEWLEHGLLTGAT